MFRFAALIATLTLIVVGGTAEAGKQKKGQKGQKGNKPNVAAAIDAIYAQHDKDGDGFLTLDEYKSIDKKMTSPSEKFKKLDTNSDEKLSKSEFQGQQPSDARKAEPKKKK